MCTAWPVNRMNLNWLELAQYCLREAFVLAACFISLLSCQNLLVDPLDRTCIRHGFFRVNILCVLKSLLLDFTWLYFVFFS